MKKPRSNYQSYEFDTKKLKKWENVPFLNLKSTKFAFIERFFKNPPASKNLRMY